MPGFFDQSILLVCMCALYYSWKREVEQYCPSGSSHPTVLELVQLLPQALHRIASSPYFDPLFWDSVESSVPASHEANGFLLKTRVAVHSFFSYLAERTEAILKKRVADLGIYAMSLCYAPLDIVCITFLFCFYAQGRCRLRNFKRWAIL